MTAYIAVFRDHGARVTIWYMLEDLFPPAKFHWMADGLVGGEEQRLLEEGLRKRLRVLRLAEGDDTQQILKRFVIDDATPDQLLLLLELIPDVAMRYFRQTPYSQHGLQERVDFVQGRIVDALDELDLPMTFTDECRLEPRTVDTTPRTLLQLLGRDALIARLPGIISDQPVVGVVFLDLDGFKAVNDTLGHTMGDACLERVSGVVSRVIHGRGTLYRYGGDEFVIVLPNFDCREAQAVAERIRCDVEAADAGEKVRVDVPPELSSVSI